MPRKRRPRIPSTAGNYEIHNNAPVHGGQYNGNIDTLNIYERAGIEEPLNASVTVKFTPTQAEQVKRIAAMHNKDTSAFVRDCVSYYLRDYRKIIG